jgi:Glycosyl transferase family 2.
VAGIRAASAPVVVLAEDHSFPDPDWAEALVAAHKDDWAVVGPVVRNGNPRSLLSWANHLLEYGPWVDGAKREEVENLPGHNSAYKRDLLLQYGDDLEELFEVETVVQRDLKSRGYRMLLEPAARTTHFNFSRLRSALKLRFHAGRSFAGHRTHGWNAGRRSLYLLGSPLIPVVRLIRIVRMLRSSPAHGSLLPRIMPMLAVVLLVDGLGEIVGYLTGPGNSEVTLGTIEFSRWRFMDDNDRKDALEEATTIVEEPPNHSARMTAG